MPHLAVEHTKTDLLLELMLMNLIAFMTGMIFKSVLPVHLRSEVVTEAVLLIPIIGVEVEVGDVEILEIIVILKISKAMRKSRARPLLDQRSRMANLTGTPEASTEEAKEVRDHPYLVYVLHFWP